MLDTAPCGPCTLPVRRSKLLIITGDHGHAWKDTTKALSEILGAGGQVKVDVTTTPSEDLTDDNLAKYDVLLLNYKDTPNGRPRHAGRRRTSRRS